MFKCFTVYDMMECEPVEKCPAKNSGSNRYETSSSVQCGGNRPSCPSRVVPLTSCCDALRGYACLQRLVGETKGSIAIILGLASIRLPRRLSSAIPSDWHPQLKIKGHCHGCPAGKVSREVAARLCSSRATLSRIEDGRGQRSENC